MKVITLHKDPKVYCCNMYLVLGDWNTLHDVNTMIDVGTNGFLIQELETINTGVGKKRVEKVILTHEHFDHSGGLAAIIEQYEPKEVWAYADLKGVTNHIKDNDETKIGDRDAIIMHTPGHSQDSVCIYVPEEKVLFSGDTQLNIKSPGGSYTDYYIKALERLHKLDIETIYPGHDVPYRGNIKKMLEDTLEIIHKSQVIYTGITGGR